MGGLAMCPCANSHESDIPDGTRIMKCCADVTELASCKDPEIEQHLRSRVFEQTQLALLRGRFDERDWDLGELQRHRMPPSSLLEYSTRCSQVYHPKDFTTPVLSPVNSILHRIPITVVAKDILEVALELKNDGFNCCVVNVANASMPGDGVEMGCEGLEEDLCRRSNLIDSLRCLYDHGHYPLPRGGSAYSPSVCFFRSSESSGFRWWGPHCFGVVSAPAIDLPEYTDENMVPRGLQEQIGATIFAVLATAQQNTHNALAMPAFGCGAPHNPPKLIARLFHQFFLTPRFQRCFKRVIFAIPEKEKELHYTFQLQFAPYN